ncbi:hypothetical protein D018_4856B, partial [Vibrio parahaemolyticus VP2007-007]
LSRLHQFALRLHLALQPLEMQIESHSTDLKSSEVCFRLSLGLIEPHYVHHPSVCLSREPVSQLHESLTPSAPWHLQES